MSKKETFADQDQQEPESGPSSFFPEKGPGMGKEVKIGLAVILVLLTVFGVLLVNRLRRPAQSPPVAEDAVKPEGTSADKPSTKDLFGGGAPAKSAVPAMVSTKPSPNGATVVGSPSKWATASDNSHMKDLTYESRSEPQPSHMPKLDVVVGNRPASPTAADSPSRAWQTGPTTGSAPGAATAVGSTSGQMTSSISVNNSQQPFDPFPKPLAPAGSPPSAVQASDTSSRAGASGAGIAAAAPVGPVLPGPTSTASAAGANTGATGGVPAADSSQQTPMPAYTGAPPASYRATADSSAATPAGYALPDAASGLRRLDPDAGRRPDGTYVVQPNENYWLISQRLYGSGAYFRALAEHNRKKYPDENRLTAGDVISAPSVAELERNYAGLCPKPEHRRLTQPDRPLMSSASTRAGVRVYVVQAGDNLFNIAKYELNNAARWAEIYELNRDLLGDQVDHLTPGMRLALPGPAGQPAARTAVQSPDSTLRR